jgi:hypothetical protein
MEKLGEARLLGSLARRTKKTLKEKDPLEGHAFDLTC